MGTFEKHKNINANKSMEPNKARGGSMGNGCMRRKMQRQEKAFN